MCTRAVIPSVTSFYALEHLDPGGFPRDVLSPLPNFHSREASSLVGSVSEESTPAVTTLTGRPTTTQAYAAQILA